MAQFEDHLEQARSNYSFLDSVDSNIPDFWDWKVTSCFYVALHLINSHIAKKCSISYRSHMEVDNVINHANAMSPAALPEDVYVSYNILYKLSRRSRYLVNESGGRQLRAFLTYDKHFSRALTHLDTILSYFKAEYGEEFNKLNIDCIEIQKKKLNFFTYQRVASSA